MGSARRLALGPGSVHAFHDRLLLGPERTHLADPVPGVLGTGAAAQALVALEEARQEQLAGQGGQLDPAPPVVVHKPGEFDAWLEDAANFLKNLPPAEAGEQLFVRRCNQCHSNDGTAKTGPTVKGVFGQSHLMRDGSSVTVDENYIRESIMDPQAKIRDGYQPVMPTFKGLLNDDEITCIIEYIKTLK